MECVFRQSYSRLGGRFSDSIFWCYIHSEGDKIVRIVLGGFLQRGNLRCGCFFMSYLLRGGSSFPWSYLESYSPFESEFFFFFLVEHWII